MIKIISPIVIFVAVFLGLDTFFVVSEGQQALITQFGKIVGKPITNAGLQFKLPFIQDVRYFDKRILSWDGDPNQIPTKDKKYILVDTTARWRIVDPVLFAQTVHDEAGVRDRLNGILDGVTRDVISRNNLVEAVRNTNTILDHIEKRAKQAKEKEKLPLDEQVILEVEEEITGDIDRIYVGRERLSDSIMKQARPVLVTLGVELIDVQLRRIAYESSVEAQVFTRMTTERQRIAEKIRSVGKAEVARINGKINLDLKEIESEAYRKSEELRGKADAEAISTYAAALNISPEYYSFLRTLEAYKRSLGDKSELILSTDSEFLGLLQSGTKR